MQPVLGVKGLKIYYPSRKVLDGVNMALYPGDFAALIGANGTGKSTLVKAALGLIDKKAGEVCLFGQSPSRFREWYKVGYLAQGSDTINAGFPATVREVVTSQLCTRVGIGRRFGSRCRRDVELALQRVGLLEKAELPLGELSGGERQRMLIARMLVTGPKLIILDEPTAGLDEANQGLLMDILEQLCENENAAVLVITHHLAEVAQRVNKIYSLANGMLRSQLFAKVPGTRSADSQPEVLT